MEQKTRLATLVAWMIRNPGVALPALAAAGAMVYFAVIEAPYLFYKGTHGVQFGQAELQKAQGEAAQAKVQTMDGSEFLDPLPDQESPPMHATDGGSCNDQLQRVPATTPKTPIPAGTDRKTVPCVKP